MEIDFYDIVIPSVEKGIYTLVLLVYHNLQFLPCSCKKNEKVPQSDDCQHLVPRAG